MELNLPLYVFIVSFIIQCVHARSCIPLARNFTVTTMKEKIFYSESKLRQLVKMLSAADCVPVYSGALDAQQDAQVDGGPAGVGLAAVAALLVARETLDALQDGVAAHAALSRLAGRVDAAGGRRRRSVQVLHRAETPTVKTNSGTE